MLLFAIYLIVFSLLVSLGASDSEMALWTVLYFMCFTVFKIFKERINNGKR